MANEEDGPSSLAARERLKRLRREAGLTPEELAAKIKRSPSSVRAHENGQNGISRKAALLYARVFRVSPSFILWGADAPEDKPPSGVRLIPVVGRLSGHVWSDTERELDLGVVPVREGHYDEFDLEAYFISVPGAFYRKGDWVIVAPPEVGVRNGDHLVIQIKDTDGLTKRTLYEVEKTDVGLTFKGLLGGADRVGVRTSWNRWTGEDNKRVKLIGPVVGYGGGARPPAGSLIRPDSLEALNVLY